MRLSELLVSIGLEAKGLKRLNQQLGEVQRNFRRSFGNIQKSVQQFGRRMTQVVTMPLAGLAAGAIKASADLERLEVSFISLTGGAEQAAAMMKNLNAFTARTPFQIDQVANAARQLIASGSGVDEVNDRLQYLGDIAATSGVSIEEIAAIFSKVNAKGKVELESLNQLAERGIPIFAALSEATGLPADKLGAGRVTVEQFNATLSQMASGTGFAAGAMDRLSQTAHGKLSTALDNVKMAGASMVEGFMPMIKTFLDSVVNVAQKITAMSDETKNMVLIVAGVLGAAGPIAMAVSALMPIIAGLTSPIGLVAAAIAGLAYLIITNFETVEPILIDIINGVITFQNKTKVLSGIWYGIGAAITTVVEIIKMVFMQTISFISGVIDAVNLMLSGEFSEAAERMGSAFMEMDKHGQDAGIAIGQAIIDAAEQTMATEDMALMEAGAIGNAAQNIKAQFEDFFKAAPAQMQVQPVVQGGGESTNTEPSTPGTFSAQAPWFMDVQNVAAADERVAKMANTMAMLGEQMQAVGGAMSQSFSQAFDTILQGGEDMGQRLTELGRQLIVNLIKIAVGNAIAAAFSPLSADNAATGGLAGIAKSAFLQGLIPSMMPKLRRGGLAFGPTTAVVGDNVGAKVDPEVIAPLSKLQHMIGGAGNMTGRISGRDILLTSSRDRNRSRRTYGSFAF